MQYERGELVWISAAKVPTSLRPVAFVACVVALSTLGPPDVRAATYTWNTTTGLWSDGANWLGGTAPADDTTTDTATFSASDGNQTVQLNASRSITGITVKDRSANGTSASVGRAGRIMRSNRRS
jgi:hypothetical protein